MTGGLLLALVLLSQQPQAERPVARLRCVRNGPVRAGNPFKPPKVRMRVEASWPDSATNDVRGTIILLVGINEKGDVSCLDVVRSIPGNDQAAIDAVRQWKYEPATVRRKP